MKTRPGEIAIVAAGLIYLAILGWAIANLSYDIWGALIVIPIYGLAGMAIVHRMFRGVLRPLAIAMTWGLLIKLGGALARYWVGFEAYEGAIDASRYHDYATDAAGKVWSGEASVMTVLPSGSGTQFLERLTALLYTMTGGSQLAGFITFSFVAYIGTVFFVKAAVVAVPDMAVRRYAWFCVLFPSLVYWPASIGKEAAMMIGLGTATYGLAVIFTHGRWLTSVLLVGAGLGFTSLIRPHIAGIWVAAALPALVVALVQRFRNANRASNGRRPSRIGILLVIGVAAVGLAVIGSATVRYLAPATDGDAATTDTLTQILDETTRRTTTLGSTFTPPSVRSPVDWPYAAVRTLTRPLPFEAKGAAQLISAAEIVVLLGVYAVSWRRLRSIPRLIFTNPYVAFAVTATFLGGLAYSSFANLGLLTRQKSLLLPFLLLLPCLPRSVWRRPAAPFEAVRSDGLAESGTPNSDGESTVASKQLAQQGQQAPLALSPTVSRSSQQDDANSDHLWG